MSAGATPQTPMGELTALPRTLARFKGPTSKGREGKGWKIGKEGEERRGEGRRGGKRRLSSWSPQPKSKIRHWTWTRLFLSSFLFVSYSHWAQLSQTVPHVGKWARFESACAKFRAFSPPKWGTQTTILDVFRRLRVLAASIVVTKREMRNPRTVLETAALTPFLVLQ